MQFGRRRFKDTNEPRRLPPLEKLAQIIISIVSIVAAVTLLLTLISPFIEPPKGGALTILGLFAPITYIANIITALYWILYWRWKFAAPIIIILLMGSYHASLLIKVPITKEYDNMTYKGMVKVMTYNVHYMKNEKDEKKDDQIAEYIERERPDILCLQEFNTFKKFEKDAPTIGKYYRDSLNSTVIYSKYPIIETQKILSGKGGEESTGQSLRVDLLIGKDTVRLFNNHLQSTSISKQDNKYLTSSLIVRDTNRSHNIIDILSRYKSSCKLRAEQVDKISYEIALSPYPTIVCGDFNDPPISYTYFKMASGLKDAFRECGNDYSHTYRGFFNTLRIDYILSKGITPRSYKADKEIRLSDHIPVVSHLKIDKKEN